MKENIERYGLRLFHTEHNHLDNGYWVLDITTIQGTTSPLTHLLFPYNLIKDGVVCRQKYFSPTNVMGDVRRFDLLPENSNDFYPLSDFCKEFTNFNIDNNDFFFELTVLLVKVTDLLKEKYQIYSNYILPTATRIELATSLITYQSLSLQKKRALDKISKILFMLT